MQIYVARNFGPLVDVVKFTTEDWGRVGRLARETIVRRTQEGRDEEDAAFRPYSPRYAEVKAEAGGAPTVDLTVSGEMLRSITVTPDEDGVTLGFNA